MRLLSALLLLVACTTDVVAEESRAAFAQRLNHHMSALRSIPILRQTSHIVGDNVVMLKFRMTKHGAITNVEVVKSTLPPELTAEIGRAVTTLPKMSQVPEWATQAAMIVPIMLGRGLRPAAPAQ